MFAVTRLSLLNSTDPKLFFHENLQKNIEDMHFLTKKSEIQILLQYSICYLYIKEITITKIKTILPTYLP